MTPYPSFILFDMKLYRDRILPPLKSFFAGGSEAALLTLLQESNQRLAADDAARSRLFEQNIEPGQSIIRLLTRAVGGGAPSGLRSVLTGS